MCGRFASSATSRALAEQFEAEDLVHSEEPNWNTAPTKFIKTISQDSKGERVLKLKKWGLVPSWSKDPKIGNKLVNARAETVASRNTFRAALSKRRCLVPVDGYYEWEVTKEGKQPWYITSPDDEGLALAGLHETWTDPDGNQLDSVVIITTAADDQTKHIHHRRPVVVPKKHWETWISNDQNTALDVLVMLTNLKVPLKMYRISKDVGNVRNNYPQLLNPEEPTDPDEQLKFGE